MTNAFRWLTTLLPAAALILSTTAGGAQAQVTQRPQQVPATGAEDAAAPTPIDLPGQQTLEAITSRSIQGLTFERRSDGTLSINLQGRFQHLLMTAPGADGRLEVSCITGTHAHVAPTVLMPSWRPVRGGAVQPIDVNALKARLPRLVTPTAAEVK